MRLLAGFLCLTASAWASDKSSDASSWSVPVPQAASTETLKALQAELAEIQAQKAKVQAEKEVLTGGVPTPPGMGEAVPPPSIVGQQASAEDGWMDALLASSSSKPSKQQEQQGQQQEQQQQPRTGTGSVSGGA